MSGSQNLSQSAWLGKRCIVSRAVTLLSSTQEVVFSFILKVSGLRNQKI